MSKFNCEQFKTKKARAHCEEASREHEEKFGSEKEEEEIPHDEPTRPPNSKAEKIAKGRSLVLYNTAKSQSFFSLCSSAK